MTGRFEHFDARSGRSYRLVLAYAHASAAYAVDSLTGTVSLYAMSELRDEPPRSLEDPRETRRDRRHGRSPRRRRITRRHQGRRSARRDQRCRSRGEIVLLAWIISPLPLNAERRLPRSHGARRYGDHPCRSDAEGQIYSRQLQQAGDYTGPHRHRSGFAKSHKRSACEPPGAPRVLVSRLGRHACWSVGWGATRAGQSAGAPRVLVSRPVCHRRDHRKHIE